MSELGSEKEGANGSETAVQAKERCELAVTEDIVVAHVGHGSLAAC